MPKESKGKIRDILLYMVFASVVGTTFLLQNYPNAMFYAMLMGLFAIMLVWLRQYHKEHHFSSLIDYDENMSLTGLVISGAAIIIMYCIASYLVENFTISSIYVPHHGLGMDFGTFQLSGIWNDYLFNLTLVAPSEELVKLVMHLALYIKLYDLIGNGLARVFSIGLPIGVWSILHAYSSYTGPNMMTLLASAFLGGIIVFFVSYKLKWTKSLLTAILIHGGYNCLVLYLFYSQNPYPVSFTLGPALTLVWLAVCGFIYFAVTGIGYVVVRRDQKKVT